MGVCDWFTLDDAVPVGENRKGTLYVVAVKGWVSNHPNGDYNKPAPRTGGHTVLNFIFCSKQTPYLLQYYNDQAAAPKTLHARALAVGQADAVMGANESDFVYYFAACHKAIVKDPYDTSLARRLGYRVAWTADTVPEDREISFPLEVLGW